FLTSLTYSNTKHYPKSNPYILNIIHKVAPASGCASERVPAPVALFLLISLNSSCGRLGFVILSDMLVDLGCGGFRSSNIADKDTGLVKASLALRRRLSFRNVEAPTVPTLPALSPGLSVLGAVAVDETSSEDECSSPMEGVMCARSLLFDVCADRWWMRSRSFD
ncbi:hypothetical protein IGI04_034151, partial [Brassica rapa subsp. trilocularis]